MKTIGRLSLTLSTIVLGAGLVGCATTDIRHQRAAEFDGAAYETFRVLSPKVGETGPFSAELARSLGRSLEAKGYRAADEADLVVGYKLFVDSEVGSVTPPPTSQMAIMDHTGAGGGAMEGAAASGVGDKMLFVFIQDARSMDVLWVGWAQASVSHVTYEEQARSALKELVAGIPRRDTL